MGRSVNKVILNGNIGNDPDTKYTQSGMAVTTLSLATTSVRKDRDGNTQERTEWHRVKLFGKLGEIAAEYLRKGSQVYIEGRLRTRKWQDKQGNDRYTTEIVGNEMQMLGSAGRGGASGGMGGGESRGGARGGARSDDDGYSEPVRSSTEKDEFDDDIPF